MLFWNKDIYKSLLQGCTQYQIYWLLGHFSSSYFRQTEGYFKCQCIRSYLMSPLQVSPGNAGVARVTGFPK